MRRRLKDAEDVCFLYGWTVVRFATDRDKACHEMWVRWSDLIPDAGPGGAPHLTDKVIADLAADRDAKRASLMRRLL